MMKEWHEVIYKGLELIGKELPEDGAWSYWKDKYGHVEVARFKFDAEDHFFPPTKLIKEENIVAWKELEDD